MKNSMKKIAFLVLLIMVAGAAFAQTKTYTLDDINIRDPYIMPDEKSGTYYMYASSSVAENGKVTGICGMNSVFSVEIRGTECSLYARKGVIFIIIAICF